jgi:uncharacterized protein YjiS (DUF1127 family)
MVARAGSPAQAATIASFALPVMREMWTSPRQAASTDLSAISETSCHMTGLEQRQPQWRRTMIRIDQTMVAEIGIWQDFPPGSGLRRALTTLGAHAEACLSRARQRRALAELDDRLLRDIGITAYDAAHEAGKPFWR